MKNANFLLTDVFGEGKFVFKEAVMNEQLLGVLTLVCTLAAYQMGDELINMSCYGGGQGRKR